MLDIKWIRENPEALDRALRSAAGRRGGARRGRRLIALDEARRAQIVKAQEAQTRRNAASKEIGQAKAAKDEATAAALMAEVAELKTFLGSAEEEEQAADKALEDALAVIPNVPLDDVPVGPTSTPMSRRAAGATARRAELTPRSTSSSARRSG